MKGFVEIRPGVVRKQDIPTTLPELVGFMKAWCDELPALPELPHELSGFYRWRPERREVWRHPLTVLANAQNADEDEGIDCDDVVGIVASRLKGRRRIEPAALRVRPGLIHVAQFLDGVLYDPSRWLEREYRAFVKQHNGQRPSVAGWGDWVKKAGQMALKAAPHVMPLVPGGAAAAAALKYATPALNQALGAPAAKPAQNAQPAPASMPAQNVPSMPSAFTCRCMQGK